MELVIGLSGLVFGGGAAAGTAAAATAGAGASFLSAAPLIGTAFTALSTLASGAAASAQAEGEAKYAEFQSNNERIKGDLQAAELKKQMALTIQRNKVAFAAGGADLGSVSAVEAKNQVTHDAEIQLGINDSNSLMASLAKQSEARRLRARSSNLMLASLFDAGATVASGALDAYGRG